VGSQALDGLLASAESARSEPSRNLTRAEEQLLAAQLAQLNRVRRQLRDEEAALGEGLFVSPNDGFAARLQSAIAEAGEGRLVSLTAGGLEIRFEEGLTGRDFGWLAAARGHFHPAAPPPRPAPGPISPIPNNARVVIIGDWGTGLYGAPVAASTIQADPRPIHLLLHLGDVYYSGSEREIQNRFLDLWPSRDDAIHRALLGNHEMYSGGHAYFDRILPAFQQHSSYFACQNDYWTLVGLDTAYAQLSSGHLDAGQLEWLEGILDQAGNRRIIFFSHHQPYSTLSDDGPRLVAALDSYLSAGRIHAWYWGHEHLCVLYDRHPVFGLHGRCVGHGGIPYVRGPVETFPVARTNGSCQWRRLPVNRASIQALVLDGPNPWINRKPERYGPQGYMTLEFSDTKLHEEVNLPDGERVWGAEVT
jgi:hypothetical protein